MTPDDYTLPALATDNKKKASLAHAPEVLEFPASVHTEIAILGAMLSDDMAIAEAVGKLTAEDFSLDSHQRIFKTIKALLELNEAVDLTTVHAELQRTHQIESIGGIGYLFHLTEGIPRNLNIESYVRIVKDKSLLRQLMSIFHDAEVLASDQNENGLDIVMDVTSWINEAVEGHQTKSEVFDSPTMAMDAAERLIDNPQPNTAIQTKFRPLDEFTNGGIRLGELWVIGASPSRGKTTLARQIVKEVVEQHIPAYVHSGEMTKESWFDVTACLIANLPAWKIREPLLMNVSEKEALKMAIKKLASLPFHISDAGGINIEKLIWNASRAVREHKIKLLVVDYAQIINATGKDDRQKVTAVAQKLRVFAKDNDVATILLSQSPRPEGRSINSRPNMFSLKESGALEEAAHCVILPFRPVDPDTNSFTGEDELVIGKQRWGSIGSIPCRLDGKYLCFVDRQVTP